ncbi:hypothetical protein ACW6G5_004691 [Pseudomonas aeruginosa]
MAKQVRSTNAGHSISAWVILNSKGEHVATVNAHYSNGGRVSVDVWNIGDKATRRSYDSAMLPLAPEARAAAMAKAERDALKKRDWLKPEDAPGYAAYDLFGLQQSSAGGYGYDKLAAALSGLVIDGHTIADHCGRVPEKEKARAALFTQYCKFHDYSGERTRAAEKGWDRAHWAKRASKIGASFANWDSDKGRYTSLHFEGGLRRLETLGYRVIQAI